jgi:hypothetical protein
MHERTIDLDPVEREACSEPSDEWPVPKSSMCNPTLSARN